jgi:hypothetical protein
MSSAEPSKRATRFLARSSLKSVAEASSSLEREEDGRSWRQRKPELAAEEGDPKHAHFEE